MFCEIKRVEGYRAEGNDFFYLSPMKVNQVETFPKEDITEDKEQNS